MAENQRSIDIIINAIGSSKAAQQIAALRDTTNKAFGTMSAKVDKFVQTSERTAKKSGASMMRLDDIFSRVNQSFKILEPPKIKSVKPPAQPLFKILEVQTTKTLDNIEKTYKSKIGLTERQYNRFAKGGYQMSSLNAKGQKQLGNQVLISSRRLDRFNMEMLGVMFFGMGAANALGQFNNQLLENVGVTDYFNLTMQMVTLDTMPGFIDIAFNAVDAINNLEEGQRRAIAETMLWGQVGGVVMQTFGSMVLGLSSLAMAFPAAAGPIGMALGTIMKNLAPMLSGLPAFAGINLADVFGGIGTAIQVGGAAQTIKTAIQLTDVITDPALLGTLTTKLKIALPMVTRAIGAVILLDTALRIMDAEAEETLMSKIELAAQAALGAAFIAPASFAAKNRIGFGIGVGLMLLGFLEVQNSKGIMDNLISIISTAMGAAVIVGALGSAGGIAATIGIPIVLVITGAIIGAGIGKIIGDLTFDAVGKGFMGWLYQSDLGKGFIEFMSGSQSLPRKQFKSGGVIPGKIGEPMPIIAHGGERFMGISGGYPRGGESTIIFSPTINISGAGDKYELERMIRDNNDRMISDLRRQVSS